MMYMYFFQPDLAQNQDKLLSKIRLLALMEVRLDVCALFHVICFCYVNSWCLRGMLMIGQFLFLLLLMLHRYH